MMHRWVQPVSTGQVANQGAIPGLQAILILHWDGWTGC